jgi:Domain of unknown function (DUF6265)
MNTNTLAGLAAATIAITAPASTSAAAKPANLDWFVGHWCSDRDGSFIEEEWLAPKGDLLLGISRTVKGAKTASFEYLRIEWQDGVPSYVAQPQGHPPVPFKWIAGGADWARFENLENDFPKRVEYRKTKDGLYAEIAGPGEGGKELVIPFDYKACR